MRTRSLQIMKINLGIVPDGGGVTAERLNLAGLLNT
jgi:hypothetical protein